LPEQLQLSVLLCRKGEVACCEEIKAFAVKHNIKQQQIAVLAGSVIVMCAIQHQL